MKSLKQLHFYQPDIKSHDGDACYNCVDIRRPRMAVYWGNRLCPSCEQKNQNRGCPGCRDPSIAVHISSLCAGAYGK